MGLVLLPTTLHESLTEMEQVLRRTIPCRQENTTLRLCHTTNEKICSACRTRRQAQTLLWTNTDIVATTERSTADVYSRVNDSEPAG